VIQNTPRPYKQKNLVEHDNKNNLTFAVIENMKYLYGALLLKYLVPSYEPDIKRPNFYGYDKHVRIIKNDADAANQAFLIEKRTITDEEKLLAAMEAAKENVRETKEAKEATQAKKTAEEDIQKTKKETTEQETIDKKVNSSIKDKIAKKTLFDTSDAPLPTGAKGVNKDKHANYFHIIDDGKVNVNPSVISPFLKRKRR